MPSRSSEAALRDILRHIDLAVGLLQGADPAGFQADIRTLYEVVRCLEIISEASRRLDDALKGRHPTIPWRDIAGAGNVYRHDYEDVTASFVWETVSRDLPLLRAAVAAELGRPI